VVPPDTPFGNPCSVCLNWEGHGFRCYKEDNCFVKWNSQDTRSRGSTSGPPSMILKQTFESNKRVFTAGWVLTLQETDWSVWEGRPPWEPDNRLSGSSNDVLIGPRDSWLDSRTIASLDRWILLFEIKTVSTLEPVVSAAVARGITVSRGRFVLSSPRYSVPVWLIHCTFMTTEFNWSWLVRSYTI
jgi:hypothetical protein